MKQETDEFTGSGAKRHDSLDFELLYLLEKEPGLSQREIAGRLGISLGKANYCLQALAHQGAVKLAKFRGSRTKLRYAYLLTAKGMGQRIRLTKRFLQEKTCEYERLKAQIKQLAADLSEKSK